MARTRPGWLTYSDGDGDEERVQLNQDMTTLGRSDTCDVVIDVPTVSRLHARIELQHDRYMLFDAGSANGTFMNGKRVEHGGQLGTGDVIWLGYHEVALHFFDPEDTLALPVSHAAAPLHIDEHARTVQVYGVPATLSPLEYGLLLHLASNPGTVCTRESCFRAVWGQPYDHATCEDALNACVTKLRRNLRASAEAAGRDTPPITTIPRVGFRLDSAVTFGARDESVAGLIERARGA